MREVTLHAGHLGNTWSMGQALQSERVDSPLRRGRDRGPREDRLTGGGGPAAQAGGPA